MVCQITELSVTTFCTFLREFSPTSSQSRRPPHIPVDSHLGFAVSDGRFAVPVADFPSCRRPRAQVGYCPCDASRSPDSVPAGRQKLASPAVTLPIRFRSCLTCLLPGGCKLPGDVVPVLEVHLVRRLPLER